MLNTLKLSTLLKMSFGIIIVLLIITSLVANKGLSNLYKGFIDYRGLAMDTNLAGRVQANMLMVRLSVLSFINTRSDEAIEQYDDRVNKMEQYLAEAKVEIQQPQRAQLVAEVAAEVQLYKEGFTSVSDLYKQRDEIVNNQLNPIGLAMRKATTEIIESAYQDGDPDAAYYASRVQEDLLLGRLYVTKYLVTNTGSDADRAFKELEARMIPALTKLDEQIENPSRRALLATIVNSHSDYLQAFRAVKAVIEQRNNLINNTLNQVGPIIADKIEQVKLSVKKDQDDLGPHVQESAETLKFVVIIISIFAVIFGIASSIIMTKIIRRPIGGEPAEIALITNRIAEGDLSQNLPLDSKDTGIYRSVVEMSQKLQELIRSLLSTSDSLIGAANNSSDIASQNAGRILEQKQMTDQVVVAVEEMSASIQEIVNNASESSKKSELGLEEANNGRVTVQQTLESINTLASNLANSMLVITELEKQSNEIGSFVEVIQGISEQTNLLALNAAIEAARAGEQGRGFAVVADEVRTLAQRTQQSTTEIQTIIQELQAGTAKAVEVMELSNKQALETVERSETIDSALASIQEVISDIAAMNAQVATAVEQQSQVTEEITVNITSISDELDETTKSTSESQMVSAEVKSLANTLNDMASSFKV